MDGNCPALQRSGAALAAVVVLQGAGSYRQVALSACSLLARLAACGGDRMIVRHSGLAEALAKAVADNANDAAVASAASRTARWIAANSAEDAVWLVRGGVATAVAKTLDECFADDAAVGAACDAVTALACTKANRKQLLEAGVGYGIAYAMSRGDMSGRTTERCCAAIEALSTNAVEWFALTSAGLDDTLEAIAWHSSSNRTVSSAARIALERLRAAKYA